MDIRQAMRQVIQDGIDGWLDACFSNKDSARDAITGFLLTRDTARVVYRSKQPYQSIEDEFLEGVDPATKTDTRFFQAWINYHWHYAHLELAENYEHMTMPLITEDMLIRREQLRTEIFGQGYNLAKVQPYELV